MKKAALKGPASYANALEEDLSKFVNIKNWIRDKAYTISYKKVLKEIIAVLLAFLVAGFIDTLVSGGYIMVLDDSGISRLCMWGIYLALSLFLLQKIYMIGIRLIWDTFWFFRRMIK